MSLGWLKTEQLSWTDENGSDQKGTWDYKVAMHKDIPKIMKIRLNNTAPEFENGNNRKRKRSGISSTRSGKVSIGTFRALGNSQCRSQINIFLSPFILAQQ